MNMAIIPVYVKREIRRPIVDHFVRKSKSGMVISETICVADGDHSTDEPKNLGLANQGGGVLDERFVDAVRGSLVL
jgi:hypothetical protein